MISTIQAYQEYLVKEKNYSLLTVQAYVSDILSFQGYLNTNHEATAVENVIYPQIRSWIVVLIENNISNKKISYDFKLIDNLNIKKLASIDFNESIYEFNPKKIHDSIKDLASNL